MRPINNQVHDLNLDFGAEIEIFCETIRDDLLSR